MVEISSSRMKSVTEARSALSALVKDAAAGLPTYITRGSTLVATLTPPSWATLALSEPVMQAMLRSTINEAAISLREQCASSGAGQVLPSPGEAIGQVLAWVRSVDAEQGLIWLAEYCKAVQAEFADAGWAQPPFEAIWAALRPTFPYRFDAEIAAYETDAREQLLHLFSAKPE